MTAAFPCIEVTRRVVGHGDATLRVLVPLPRRMPVEALVHLRRKVEILRRTACEERRGGYGAWVVAPSLRAQNTSAINVRRWRKEGVLECRPVMIGRVRRLMFRITPKGRSLLLRLEASLERIDRAAA